MCVGNSSLFVVKLHVCIVCVGGITFCVCKIHACLRQWPGVVYATGYRCTCFVWSVRAGHFCGCVYMCACLISPQIEQNWIHMLPAFHFSESQKTLSFQGLQWKIDIAYRKYFKYCMKEKKVLGDRRPPRSLSIPYCNNLYAYVILFLIWFWIGKGGDNH